GQCVPPEDIAGKDDLRVRDQHHGVTSRVPRKAAHLNRAGAEVEIDALVENNSGRRECFNKAPLLGLESRTDHFSSFCINPATHVALRQHGCPGVDKDSVSADMVEVVVRVDDKSHRKLRPFADLCQKLLGRLSPEVATGIGSNECIDHEYSVITN